MPAFLNFRGVGYTESLTDWRNSYFGKNTMTPTTKLAKNLVPGDRVKMGGDEVRTVATVGKGFARMASSTGKPDTTLIIDWKEGEWTQVARNQVCYLAPAKKVKA
jgi:hypothetical protein